MAIQETPRDRAHDYQSAFNNLMEIYKGMPQQVAFGQTGRDKPTGENRKGQTLNDNTTVYIVYTKADKYASSPKPERLFFSVTTERAVKGFETTSFALSPRGIERVYRSPVTSRWDIAGVSHTREEVQPLDIERGRAMDESSRQVLASVDPQSFVDWLRRMIDNKAYCNSPITPRLP